MEQSTFTSSSFCSSFHISCTYCWLLYLWSLHFSLSHKIKISSLSHFLSTIICTHLGFSWTDISGIDPAWPFHLIFISYQLTFTSFIHAIFCLFLPLQVFKNKLSLICSTFISTLNQLHSILLFIITSSRTISFFSLFISFIFIWSKKVKVKVKVD